MTLFSLKGKRALVTGGSRGLGFEIAKGLAMHGADVIINSLNERNVNDAVHNLKNIGLSVQALPFDVSDQKAVEEAFARLDSQGRRIEIFVNNAGMRNRQSFFDLTHDDVRRIMEVDLIAPFALCREVAKRMIKHGAGGRLINITSIAGPIAQSGDAAYTTAKGGLAAFTRALAAELGPHSITVNAVAPGFFATEANLQADKKHETENMLSRRTSLGRFGRPEEIAGAVVFLASDAASYVTGEVITVDGGYLAHF